MYMLIKLTQINELTYDYSLFIFGIIDFNHQYQTLREKCPNTEQKKLRT